MLLKLHCPLVLWPGALPERDPLPVPQRSPKLRNPLYHLPKLVVSQEDLEIGSKSYYLEDTGRDLSIQDILLRLDEFKELPEKGPNFGLTQSAYWFATLVEWSQSDASMVWKLSILSWILWMSTTWVSHRMIFYPRPVLLIIKRWVIDCRLTHGTARIGRFIASSRRPHQ